MKEKRIGYLDLSLKEFRKKFTASLFVRGIHTWDTQDLRTAKYYVRHYKKERGIKSKVYELILREVHETKSAPNGKGLK